MSRSRHSSIVYFGSPRLCSPNSRMRFPVKSLIGEIDANASARPSVLNQSKLAFCSSMRFGISRTCGIFAKVWRSRRGPGSGGCSTVNAPVGIGKVDDITWEAPLVVAAGARFDLLLVPAGLFAETFGAVVFAMNLFLYGAYDSIRTLDRM